MDRPRGVRLPAYGGLLALVASLLVLWPAGQARHHLTAADCGAAAWVLQIAGQPDVCAHPDAAPAGVDVHTPVSVADLRSRRGGGPRAYAAAQALGVPGYYASTATSSAVTCDGDGVSGARMQAMYVVEAGRANRYASLLPSLQLWAAGVDDVLNRSAALTGGARSVRYVTDPSGGGCVARVLNLTVPAGALASFSSTIQAVQALGYASPARKYLMWTDATSLCGIATMYPDETAGQSNANNGSYPEYARIDSGCWGLGNGTNQHSVEAHELTHTLGAVQNQAPHSTRAGHCWDEADTMCYTDGSGRAMVQVCPPEREYLLDCNSDDYWSTYPPAGSYLASAWDAANSRFLIGGGNGTGGGTLGSPTSLGGALVVNNPAVPGLPTQASVTPELPTGRTLLGVTWKVANPSCEVAPNGTQAVITCPATSLASTMVTATLTDSSGAVKAVAGPLTFQVGGTPRPLALALTVDGQSAATSVCSWVPAAARVSALDAATGVPVKGLLVTYTRQATGAPAPSPAGLKVTGGDGTAVAGLVTGVATTYAATTAATGMFQAATAPGVPVTPGQCTAHLTGSPSTSSAWYGDTVTVTGALRRTVATADDTPVAGAAVVLTVRTADTGRTVPLVTATTDAAGAFRVMFRATLAGRLTVSLPASAGFLATTADLGDLTIRTPTTVLTASASTTDTGYGGTVTVSGTLQRVTDAPGPLVGAPVLVRITPAGRLPVPVGYGTVRADGSYSVAVAARTSGEITVLFGGAAGLPAATADAGPVTVGSWTPTITLTTGSATVNAGAYVECKGTVRRSYGGTDEGARGVLVALVLTPANGTAPQLMTYAWTSGTGAFWTLAYPRVSGTIRAVVVGVPGYTDASSPGVQVTVT